MLLGTHIALPMIPLAWKRLHSIRRGDSPTSTSSWPWLSTVGLFGALPDLLNPHLSLESRLSSWSHGLPFTALLGVLLLLGCAPVRSPLTLRRAGYLWCAYLLHLTFDALSGGIAWLNPWRDNVIGAPYIPPGAWWYISDFVCLFSCYLLLRILPMLARQRAKNARPR